MNRNIIFIFVISAILTGCSSKEDTDKPVEISKYITDYSSDCEMVKNTEYSRLDFSDTLFMDISNAKSVGEYKEHNTLFTADESIEIIENWLDEIGVTDIDLNIELRDASGQYERKDGAEYPYDYPAVYDYYPDFDSGRGFFINTNKCYIQMGDNTIYAMSNGVISRACGNERKCGPDAYGSYTEELVEEGYVEELLDKEYELLSGTMSVKDGAEVVKEYLEAGIPLPLPEEITIDVPYVKIRKINNTEKYCYEFLTRRIYNGIPVEFEYLGRRTFYGDYSSRGDSKQVYVADGRVDAFVGNSDVSEWELQGEETTRIISLSGATWILNEYLAKNLSMKIERVELAYFPLVYESAGEEKIIYPCWEYKGYCKTNDRPFMLFVNVISGDVYYYAY